MPSEIWWDGFFYGYIFGALSLFAGMYVGELLTQTRRAQTKSVEEKSSYESH